MHVRRLAATGLLLATCGLATGAATPAFAVCDAYSTTCANGAPTTPPGNGGGGDIDVSDDEQVDGNGGGTVDGNGGGDTVDGNGGDTVDGNGGGTVDGNGGGTASSNRTLPFTGGELVLLTTLGGAALVGGTALVLAGRRKTSPST